MHRIYINDVPYKVNHPMEIIRAFWVFDNSFLEYDLKKVTTFIEAVETAPKIATRINAELLRNCFPEDKRKMISTKIEHIPNEELVDMDDKKWLQTKNDITELILYTLCKNVRISRATKILHKLRPGLIPILDEKMIQKKIYETSEPGRLLDLIRNDIRKSQKLLKSLKKEIYSREKISLSTTRIFDILLWTYAQETIILENNKIKDGITSYFYDAL